MACDGAGPCAGFGQDVPPEESKAPKPQPGAPPLVITTRATRERVPRVTAMSPGCTILENPAAARTLKLFWRH